MVGQKYKRGDLVLYTDGYYGAKTYLVITSSEENYKIAEVGYVRFLAQFDRSDRTVRDWQIKPPYVYKVIDCDLFERNSIKLEKSYFGSEAIKYINQIQKVYFKSEVI